MIELFEGAVEVVVPIALGILILLSGRRFFWIVGGAALSFFAAVLVALIFEPAALQPVSNVGFDLNFENPPIPPVLAAAVIGGILGIWVTLKYPAVASAVVGFVGGIFVLVVVLDLFALTMPEPARRTLLLIAGVAVGIVGLRNPNQMMILLSTFAGAGLILEGAHMNWNEPLSAIVWLLLMLTGIIYQTNSLRVHQQRAKAAASASVAVATTDKA